MNYQTDAISTKGHARQLLSRITEFETSNFGIRHLLKRKKTIKSFTGYQKGVIALLAVVQFTIVLDFMVMAPLGDLLMKTLDLKSTELLPRYPCMHSVPELQE